MLFLCKISSSNDGFTVGGPTANIIYHTKKNVFRFMSYFYFNIYMRIFYF